MRTYRRIQGVFTRSKRISFGDREKFVLISDCHRGEGDSADNFAKNHNLYTVALEHYDQKGFTYIELGDGDELWENRSFAPIAASHASVFKQLMRFHQANRLHFIYGNHDIAKKNKKWVQDNLHYYFNPYLGRLVPLFPDLTVEEGLVLHHEPTGGNILLLHGHQADFFNDALWPLSEFLVRYLWRPLRMIGIRDPVSPARNSSKKKTVEQKLIAWAAREKTMLIAGHTHRSVFPAPGEIPYFNDGSCVHPRHILALEIQNSAIVLVKWHIQAGQDDALYVRRKIVAGPQPLAGYFNQLRRPEQAGVT